MTIKKTELSNDDYVSLGYLKIKDIFDGYKVNESSLNESISHAYIKEEVSDEDFMKDVLSSLIFDL